MQEATCAGSRTSLTSDDIIIGPEAREISVAENTAAAQVTAPVLPRSNMEKRKRRANSAFAKPAIRSGRIPRRPYSAYTRRAGEAENMPKYDGASSNREWWRFYLNVSRIALSNFFFVVICGQQIMD